MNSVTRKLQWKLSENCKTNVGSSYQLWHTTHGKEGPGRMLHKEPLKVQSLEKKTSGAAKMKQWLKGQRPETAAMTVNR
jgi:hypothetical protein